MIVVDKFNSEQFNIKMGNCNIKAKDEIGKVVSVGRQEGYKHLATKISTGEIQLINELLENGFYLVDTLISYKFDFKYDKLPTYIIGDEIQICGVEYSDINEIGKIAAESFSHDRFHNDKNLPDALCDKYYKNWAENSCRGFADIVLVAKNNKGDILGFITGKQYEDTCGAIVLNAVKKSARGKGVYTALVYEIMRYFNDKVDVLTVGTQINTYAAQRTWAKLGFKVYDSKYVLHKML